MQKTRNQQFAEKIYERVINVSQDQKNEYGSMCHKLPMLIRTAGLAQALAFVDARGKDAHKAVLTDLANVLDTAPKQLLAQSRTTGLAEYMYLTRQSLLALTWFKRFAQSVLDVESASTEQGGEGND